MKTIAQQLQDKKNKFSKLLDLNAVDFMDVQMTIHDRKFHIDTIKLADWFVHMEKMKKDESLSDFLERTYGKETMEWVRDNI